MAAAEDDYNYDYYGYKVLVSMFIPNSLLYAFVVPDVLLHVFCMLYCYYTHIAILLHVYIIRKTSSSSQAYIMNKVPSVFFL